MDIPFNDNHNKIPLIAIESTERTGPNILKEGIADNLRPSGQPISKKPAAIR